MARTRKRHPTGEFRAHIKKGDTVHVLTGKSEGEEGKVAQVLPRNERAIVEGVNLMTRHQRARGGRQVTAEQQSGRIQKPAPIHVSNLMVVDPDTNEPTRVSHQQIEGKSVRVSRKGNLLDRDQS